MNRTHIYLTDEQTRIIKLHSIQEKKPEAQIIRDLLDAGIKGATPMNTETVGDALLNLAELGKKHKLMGPKNLSTSLDEYLYGDKA